MMALKCISGKIQYSRGLTFIVHAIKIDYHIHMLVINYYNIHIYYDYLYYLYLTKL